MDSQLRQVWLVNRAADWLNTLMQVSDTRRIGEPDTFREIETALYGMHLVVLSANHLKKCLDLFEHAGGAFPSGLILLVQSFQQAYVSCHVVEARNALEHEEDRVEPKDPRSKQNQYNGPYPNPHVIGRKANSFHFTQIQVLDEDYDLTEVLEVASKLRDPLREFAVELQTTRFRQPS